MSEHKAFTLIEMLVVISIIALLMAILMPVLIQARRATYKMICSTNLKDIGASMIAYSYENKRNFPKAGNWGAKWGWPKTAWTSPHGPTTTVSASSHLYLLIKYGGLSPKEFICKGDEDVYGATVFRPTDYDVADADIQKLWDFGCIKNVTTHRGPTQHCSYSYHCPFGDFYISGASPSGVAVAADRNPYITPHNSMSTKAEEFVYDGTDKEQMAGNSGSHYRKGQNVLFVDGSVTWQTRSFCSVAKDNIYTYWSRYPRGGALASDKDRQEGTVPEPRFSENNGLVPLKIAKDSLLINEGYAAVTGPIW